MTEDEKVNELNKLVLTDYKEFNHRLNKLEKKLEQYRKQNLEIIDWVEKDKLTLLHYKDRLEKLEKKLDGEKSGMGSVHAEYPNRSADNVGLIDSEPSILVSKADLEWLFNWNQAHLYYGLKEKYKELIEKYLKEVK